MATTQATHKFDLRLYLIGIFLLILALGTIEGPRGDSGWRLVITRQLLTNGSVHLAQEPSESGLIETPWGWTSYFAIGQTLLFIPFEIAGKAVSLLAPTLREFPTTRFYCPVIGVIYFAALMALLEAFGLSRRTAAISALVFTFCSVSAYYVTQSFQEESIAAVFVCLATRAALLWRQSPRARYAFQLALFGSCILLFRFNGIFALIPAAILILQGLAGRGGKPYQPGTNLAAVFLGILGPAIVHLVFAYLRFGDPFSTGYDQVYTGEHMTEVSSPPVFQVETGTLLLFGLGKGLFIYSPLLFIALWGFCVARPKLIPYGIGCLAAVAAGLALSIRIFPLNADGCWSWGARYQVHLLPLFAYPAWVGMQDLARRHLKALVTAVLALGLFFQVCSFLGSERVEYQQVNLSSSDEVCSVVRQNQFSMRLATIARAVGITDGNELMDDAISREFGTMWVIWRQRSRSLTRKVVVTTAWVMLLAGAAFCLYRSLRAEKNGSDKPDIPVTVQRVTTRL